MTGSMCSQGDSEFSVINIASGREMDWYCFWNSSSQVELKEGWCAGLESLGKRVARLMDSREEAEPWRYLGTAAASSQHESLVLLKS